MSTKVRSIKRSARSARKPRLTVQLSSYLVAAVEERAAAEAIPVAVFIRRAVTRLVNEAQRTGKLPRREITDFEEAQRHGRRGPMRQWPKSVSYVADTHIADGLKALAEEHEVDVSVLAREALVQDLDRPGTVRRVQPGDENGFTTSGAPPRGRASQQIMNEAWRSTNA
jgi:hypothetical protein